MAIKQFILLAVLLTLVASCRVNKPQPKPPVVQTTTATHTEASGGTDKVGYTKPDSSLTRALIECDSLGNAYIKMITELRSGETVSSSVSMDDHNTITLRCNVDSAAVWMRWNRFSTSTADTNTTTKILPGSVVVTNILKWWQQVLMYAGFGFIAIAAYKSFTFIKTLKNPLAIWKN